MDAVTARSPAGPDLEKVEERFGTDSVAGEDEAAAAGDKLLSGQIAAASGDASGDAKGDRQGVAVAGLAMNTDLHHKGDSRERNGHAASAGADGKGDAPGTENGEAAFAVEAVSPGPGGGATQAGVASSGLLPDPVGALVETTPAPAPTATGRSAPPVTSAPLPTYMQIAQALSQNGEARVELTLAPHELGRVRLHLHHGVEGLSVQIAAERPETLELIRRHLDDLGRELRALGHHAVAFDFGGNPGQDRQGPPAAAHRGAVVGFPDDQAPPEPVPAARVLATTAGLDIRL